MRPPARGIDDDVICAWCGFKEFEDVEDGAVCARCGSVEFEELDDSVTCPGCGSDQFEELAKQYRRHGPGSVVPLPDRDAGWCEPSLWAPDQEARITSGWELIALVCLGCGTYFADDFDEANQFTNQVEDIHKLRTELPTWLIQRPGQLSLPDPAS